MLTEQQLAVFKQRLQKMRQHMQNRINNYNNQERGGGLGLSTDESLEELSSYDNHPADLGSEMFERSKDLALKGDAKFILLAVEDALAKLETGRYGICEVCGREIPPARLEAVPYTTQCSRCKSKDESLPRPRERTAEEDVLADPFSRAWRDNEDYNGFDGEDAWETVARWNEHADRSQAGSYYGDEELINEEHTESFTDPDSVPYEVDDGVFYQSFREFADERTPLEKENNNHRGNNF
nr:TraR/DksA C4-type zinc finger protein [Desulforamulus hydrothermalis]